MKRPLFNAAASVAAVIFLSMAPTQSNAAETVNVSLWDKGADMDMPMGLGMGMSGDMSMVTMGVKATARRGQGW